MKKFFILGCSRSGTTLLSTQLNKTGNIIIPPETWWLSSAYDLGIKSFHNSIYVRAFLMTIKKAISVSENKAMIDATDAFIKEHLHFKGTYRELLDVFGDFFIQHFNVDVFGEKTPAHTTFMYEINDVFKEYKKIIIFRDPRDLVFSYFKAWYNNKYSEENLYNILMNLKVYLYYLLNELQGDFYTLKYEDLTIHPEEEIENILKYLEVEKEKGDVDIEQVVTAKAEGIHANLTKKVFRNQGNYHQLPEGYIEIIENVLLDEMKHLKYSLETDKSTVLNGTMFENLQNEAMERVKHYGKMKRSENWKPHYVKIFKQYIKSFGILQ